MSALSIMTEDLRTLAQALAEARAENARLRALLRWYQEQHPDADPLPFAEEEVDA